MASVVRTAAWSMDEASGDADAGDERDETRDVSDHGRNDDDSREETWLRDERGSKGVEMLLTRMERQGV